MVNRGRAIRLGELGGPHGLSYDLSPESFFPRSSIAALIADHIHHLMIKTAVLRL